MSKHQFTQEFTQLDGTPNRAIVFCRAKQNGFVGGLKIGRISKQVTATYVDAQDALNQALRHLMNHKENAIL
jgi:hypothetical protein